MSWESGRVTRQEHSKSFLLLSLLQMCTKSTMTLIEAVCGFAPKHSGGLGLEFSLIPYDTIAQAIGVVHYV